jgi:hypothetical protein
MLKLVLNGRDRTVAGGSEAVGVEDQEQLEQQQQQRTPPPELYDGSAVTQHTTASLQLQKEVSSFSNTIDPTDLDRVEATPSLVLSDTSSPARLENGDSVESLTRKNRTKLTPIPIGDLETVADFYEHACVQLSNLSDVEISEVRSLRNPQPRIRSVLEAVMILKGVSTDWRTARKEMARSFRRHLITFEKDQVTKPTLDSLLSYPWVHEPDFDVAAAFDHVSPCAGVICSWVRAVYTYCRALAEAGPKMLVLQEATRRLALERQQRQTAAQAFGDPKQKLVYINGGTELVSIEAVQHGKRGRQRVIPGIALGESKRDAGAQVVTRRRPKRPTPPKAPKGAKSLRSIRRPVAATT